MEFVELLGLDQVVFEIDYKIVARKIHSSAIDNSEMQWKIKEKRSLDL